MELKLTLQRIEPYESFVSETWCPPKLVPTVERMDKEFFESFLMDEFSEEVWDYFHTEFDDIRVYSVSHYICLFSLRQSFLTNIRKETMDTGKD